MRLALLLAPLLLAGCVAPAAPSRPKARYVVPPALQGQSADIARVASQSLPSVVRITTETQLLKPGGRYLTGLAQSFAGIFVPHPYWEWPYRVLQFPVYLLFGMIDFGDSRGSGFFVGPDLVLTNAHVVDNAATLTCELADGRTVNAVLERSDPQLDLALLRLEGRIGPAPPTLALSRFKPRIGEPVLALGYPAREGDSSLFSATPPTRAHPRVTVGVVSADGVELGNPHTPYLEIDAALNPGNSGGPVVGLHGEVLGIATMVGVGKENEGYAVPAHIIRSAFKDLLPVTPEGPKPLSPGNLEPVVPDEEE